MNGCRIPHVYVISNIPINPYIEVISTMKSFSSIVLAACIVTGTTISAEADERLVLVGASYGNNVLAICESDGKVIWKHNTAGPQKGHAGHHVRHRG